MFAAQDTCSYLFTMVASERQATGGGFKITKNHVPKWASFAHGLIPCSRAARQLTSGAYLSPHAWNNFAQLSCCPSIDSKLFPFLAGQAPDRSGPGPLLPIGRERSGGGSPAGGREAGTRRTALSCALRESLWSYNIWG